MIVFEFISFLLLSLVHFLTGCSLLSFLSIRLSISERLAYGLLIGVGLFSFIPVILGFLHVPIQPFLILAICGVLSVGLIIFRWKALQLSAYGELFRKIRWSALPVLTPLLFLFLLSCWRAYYLPPYAVDVTSGAETLAEFAIREGRFVNSVFDLYQTGNTLKPAFLVSLQIIYKSAGIAFGQLWLVLIVAAFLILMISHLAKRIHWQLALFLVLLFYCIPELYAHSYSMLYDFPNLIYFIASLLLLFKYLESGIRQELLLSSMMMCVAVYIRPETILLAILLILLSLIFMDRKNLKAILRSIFLFLLWPVLTYVVFIYGYIHYFIPVEYDISAQVNPRLSDWFDCFVKFKQAFSCLFLNDYGLSVYSVFPHLFILLVLAELFYARRFSKKAIYFMSCLLLVFLFFPLLSHVLPGVTIDNTVKRAYFKLFPIMLLILAELHWLQHLSKKIKQWTRKKVD
jgi:hypothetical protein